MTWPEADLWDRLVARTEPGPGAELADSGVPGEAHLKMRSIPNVDTPRLQRVLAHLHEALHTDALIEFDEPRRSLANGGLRAQAIVHELRLRGKPTNDCPLCNRRAEGR